MMSLFGLTRIVVFAVNPCRYMGTLQQNAGTSTVALMAAVEILLCAPLGFSSTFCAWGRAAATIFLRSDDVSINDVPLVVFVMLNSCVDVSMSMLCSVSNLILCTLQFDREGRRSPYVVIDVIPRINWYHVGKALECGMMLYDSIKMNEHTSKPTWCVLALIQTLKPNVIDDRAPGISIVDSPWLVSEPRDRRPFRAGLSDALQLETVTQFYDPMALAATQREVSHSSLTPTVPFQCDMP